MARVQFKVSSKRAYLGEKVDIPCQTKKKEKQKEKRQQISVGWGGEIRNRCLPLLELY